MKKILAIMLILVVALSLIVTVAADDFKIVGVVADKNPSAENPGTRYGLNLSYTTSGKAQFNTGDDGIITLTATPEEGHNFREWIIEGEYEIVAYDLKSSTLRIKPLTELKVLAAFDNETEPVNTWGDSESPKTGYVVAPVVALCVVALFGAGVCTKKALAK